MAEARSRERWARTAALMALTANCHRDPKKTRLFQPADFDPHRGRKDAPPAKTGIDALKVFVPGSH